MQPPCERFSLHLRVLCDSRPPVLSPLPTSVTREGGNERGGSEWAETHIVLVRVGPMIALFIMVLLLMGCPKPNTLSSIVLATHSFQFKPRGRPVISALCCTRPNEMTSRPRPTKRREARESRGGSNRKRLQLQLYNRPRENSQVGNGSQGSTPPSSSASVRPSGISLSSRRLCRTLAPCVWRGVVHSVADGAFPAELRIPLRSTTRIPAMRQNSPREGRTDGTGR